MLKVKEFSTTKGDFVLVEFPTGSTMILNNKGEFSLDFEDLPFKVSLIGELKTLTKKQAEKIVDSIQATMETENKPVTLYEHKNSRNAYLSASICLIDYLKSLDIHLYENRTKCPCYTITAYGVHPDGYKRFELDKEAWQQAEENTFYNPIILKRI